MTTRLRKATRLSSPKSYVVAMFLRRFQTFELGRVKAKQRRTRSSVCSANSSPVRPALYCFATEMGRYPACNAVHRPKILDLHVTERRQRKGVCSVSLRSPRPRPAPAGRRRSTASPDFPDPDERSSSLPSSSLPIVSWEFLDRYRDTGSRNHASFSDRADCGHQRSAAFASDAGPQKSPRSRNPSIRSQ